MWDLKVVAAADLFVQDLPVVTTGRGLADEFVATGYAVGRGLVPRDVVEVALARVERLSVVGDGRVGIHPQLEACLTPEVRAAAGELLGPLEGEFDPKGPVALPRSHEPNAEWGAVAHLDSRYPTLQPETWSLAVFVFLSPVSSRGGALCLLPGSHRAVRAALADSPAEFMRTWWGARDDLVEILVEPGDALFVPFMCLHSGSPNVASPTTCHVLRWDVRTNPTRPPIRPERPTREHLAPIEKVHSTPFLLPALAASAVAAPSDPRAVTHHVVLRDAGRCQRWFVDGADTVRVRRRSSQDLASWRDEADLAEGTSEVTGLAATVFPGGAIVALSRGHRHELLHLGAHLEGRRCSQGDLETHSIALLYARAYRRGGPLEDDVIYFAKGAEVFALSADAWADIDWSASPTPVGTVPNRGVITDLVAGPVIAGGRCALIAETEDGSLFGSVTRDAAHHDLTPLATDCPQPARQPRLYERSRDFWIVSYLAQSPHGHLSPRWATIDWATDRTLRDIATADQLLTAYTRVGLR